MKYTVVLMRPDYVAETFGQDAAIVHVTALNAVSAARTAAVSTASNDKQEAKAADDYFPVAVFPGWLDDLSAE